MKSWSELKSDMVVYIKNPIEIYDLDELLGTTKPYQRAYVEHYDGEEIVVIIYSGKFEGYDLYWHASKDKPEELLTKEEYSLLNISEKKIWIELNKILKKIDSLKEKSDDIIKIKELIEKNTK